MKSDKTNKGQTMEIVINKCFGGFSISKKAAQFMAKRGNKQAQAELDESKKDMWYGFGYSKDFTSEYDRKDPDLIAAVKDLGSKANGMCASLKIINIPDDVDYEIDNYDGLESIHESHRTWD